MIDTGSPANPIHTGENTKEAEKALRDLLKLIADHPELADRITITIKPSKIKQGEAKSD